MKANELREKSVEELNKELENSRQELFNLRFQRVVGQVENKTKIRNTRREIARILTILNEMQSQEQA
jgi:large subunit ribosomal protein L29